MLCCAVVSVVLQDLFVIPAAQTLRLQPKPDALEDWGLLTLNVSAGDWVRLVVPRSNRDVELPQPLILTGDVIFSGASMANGNSGGQGKRDAAMPVLRCKKGATTAISIRCAWVDRRGGKCDVHTACMHPHYSHRDSMRSACRIERAAQRQHLFITSVIC